MLFRRFICIVVCLSSLGAPFAAAKWEEQMARFAAADRAAPSPEGSVLFIGSSSIRRWQTLAKDFPQHAVINRGFGGSEISDSIKHFDVLVRPHRPRLIVFYAGSNDLARGKTPEQVAGDFATFCEKVHALLPQTRVLFLSIVAAPKRLKVREQIAAANQAIAEICAADPRREFLDVNAVLVGEDGTPRGDFFAKDKLHLSSAGYGEWVRTLGPRWAIEPMAATADAKAATTD